MKKEEWLTAEEFGKQVGVGIRRAHYKIQKLPQEYVRPCECGTVKFVSSRALELAKIDNRRRKE